MKVSMTPASAATKPSFVVVLLLWFSYHVFLSSALYLEPPFTRSKVENIRKYNRIPADEELEIAAAIGGIDWLNFGKDMSYAADTTKSQPNPIAKIFPDGFTGVINGTYAVLPIDYELARSIIPSRYRILNAGIHRFFPSLPTDKYPVGSLLQSSQYLSDIQKAFPVSWDLS